MTGVTAAPGDVGPAGLMSLPAYAARIKVSRAMVYKHIDRGRIYGPALVVDPATRKRLIVAEIADRQIAEAADPAHERRDSIPVGDDSSYAHERMLKTRIERERAELELHVRRGELVARADNAAVLQPWVRELRDALIGVPRDCVLDPVQAADCERAIAQKLEMFSDRLSRYVRETMSHGADAGAV